jgi:hypothetical protein
MTALDSNGTATDALPRHIVAGSGIPTVVIGSSIYYPRTFSPRLRESLRMAFIDLPLLGWLACT